MIKKKRIFGIIVFVFMIITLSSCNLFSKNDSSNDEIVDKDYTNISKVGYACEYLGTVKRNIPSTTKDEGYSSIGYPSYGVTMTNADTTVLRQDIIDEANYLTSVNTSGAGGGGYNRIDSEGYLYLDDEPVLDTFNNHRQLYKHTASVGHYLGDVSDSEEAIIKKLTYSYRGYTLGYGITGLYAPAGEVVKVELTKEDMELTGGITIHIGQALFNGQANNIWADREIVRMPYILNTLVIDKNTCEYDETSEIYTAYIGSYLGGAIYVRNETETFSVTISGAVKYSHFILGYTTEEEFKLNASSSAPYFDLEVCYMGVLHSGPKEYAENFSYDDLYNAAVLWDKIANISTEYKKQGIVFLYDSFVAAGAAVAFPGRNAVNCPLSWMTSSLDYNSFYENGSWGNIHEYNHNFQGFGVGNGTEVTNNAISLVEYSQLLNISSKRQLGNISDGLSDWNRYTSPTYSLRDVTDGIFNNGNYGLSVYSNFLYSFGASVFMDAVTSSTGDGIDKWFVATTYASGYDMTYYFTSMLGYEVSSSVLEEIKALEYPMYIPVATIYQTGTVYNNTYAETVRPYQIKYGEDYLIDLTKYTVESNNYISGSLVIPDGFSYTVKSISNPSSGSLTKVSDNIYKYSPGNSLLSGKIYLTLEITKDDNLFEVEDIVLVLEFEQTYEIDKYVINRTTYTYDELIYNDAYNAYLSNYSGYNNMIYGANDNTFSSGRVVQDCSAEVWLEDYNSKTILEISGKYKISDSGTYRIALRGRYNCCLLVSLDGINYTLAATYTDNSSGSPDFPLTNGTYMDYTLESNSWLYFKAVLICGTGYRNSFIGVGLGMVDSTGNANISKVNAYNINYKEIENNFNSDYFYSKDYSYDYKDNKTYLNTSVIDSQNYSPWTSASHSIDNLIDGDYNTYIHTNYEASSDKPLSITIDLGDIVTANRLNLYTQARIDVHYPKSFILYGSLDGINFFVISEFSNATLSGNLVSVDFDTCSFRYYKLYITESSNTYIILSEVEVLYINEINDFNQISLDDSSVLLYGDFIKTHEFSTFGSIYKSSSGDYITFTFTGTLFGIITSEYSNNFKVYIDGIEVSSINLKSDSGLVVSYISEKLTDKLHTVKIVSNGTIAFDSLIYR